MKETQLLLILTHSHSYNAPSHHPLISFDLRLFQSWLYTSIFGLFSKAPDWSKFFKHTFETYFLMKVHKAWMRNHWSENPSNYIYQFSESVIELEFQPIGFLGRHFFITFVRKLTQMLILTVFFRILAGLTEKWRKRSIFYYKNKNIYNFYALTIKIEFRNVSEKGGLDGKTEQNRFKVFTLALFFQKKSDKMGILNRFCSVFPSKPPIFVHIFEVSFDR